jgi:hypothetical protein
MLLSAQQRARGAQRDNQTEGQQIGEPSNRQPRGVLLSPNKTFPTGQAPTLSLLTQVRLVGAICALVFLIGLVSAFAGTRGARLTDIQLGTDPVKVQQVIAGSAIRDAANRAIAIDYFFLAAYWAAFVALAILLGRRAGVWLVVAALAAMTATATATLDIVENLHTSEVLALFQTGGPLGQKQLDALRHISLFKWAASATTVALLAGVFAQRTWVAVLAVLLLAVAGIGFAGLHWRGLIQAYLLGVGILTLTIAILFLAFPNAETRGF